MKEKLLLFLVLLATFGFAQNPAPTLELDGIQTKFQYHPDSEHLVIIVHGSGDNGMDGLFTFDNHAPCIYDAYKGRQIRVLKDIADNLYQLGFSVLRYEKLHARAHAKTTNYLPEELVADLHLICTKLQNQAAFKGKKLLLFGWSEGVTVALNTMPKLPHVAGVIGYGGVFNDPIQLSADKLYQTHLTCNHDSLNAVSLKQQFIEQASAEKQDNDQIILDLQQYDPKDGSLIGISQYFTGFTRSYFKNFSHLVEASVDLLKNKHVPILLVHGTTDHKVHFSQHQFLKEQALTPLVSIKALANTDHFMRKDFQQEINPELFQLIEAWREKVLTD